MIREHPIRLPSWVSSCALLAAVFCGPAHAQLAVVEERGEQYNRIIYKMTVTPAPEPNPPLRHRLVLREIELKPGNAATHYLRAFPESGFERLMNSMDDKYGEEFHDWYRPTNVPLGKLPLKKAREAAAAFDSVVSNFIAPATIRRDCDWGLGIEEMRGPKIYQILLPEFQASRSFTRILALRARVAIAEGDYDQALDQLRMNYRMAQNIGSEPLLVCGLIGIAEAAMGNEQVIELMGARGSPNLYWALAELPRPIVDIRKAVRFEMSVGLRVFPALLDAETASHSPEEWARLLAKSLSDAGELTGADWMKGAGSMTIAGLSSLMYSQAKQRLIEGGMAADRVKAMPVGQVIAIDAAREYRRLADELEKWMYVPYHVVRKRDPKHPFDKHGISAATQGYGYILAGLLFPAVQAARSAQARIDWQLRAMQVVEAVRMHAAASGALPASLNEIDVVPIPINPATNQPYAYHLDGDKAVLDLPFSDGFAGIAWRFEISLAADD